MTSLACILAAPDLPHEPELVAQSAAFDLHIVRRCLDAADLMAVAALEPGLPVLVTPGLPHLARELISRLLADRLVVGLAIDEHSAEQLLSLGIAHSVRARAVEHTLEDLCAVLRGRTLGPMRARQQGVWSTGAWAPEPTPAAPRRESPSIRGPISRGGVICVWGPPGSPGRTSATLMLGRLFAASGSSVCLIDADTTAPSLLQICGIAESASSLVVACRFAERDSLDSARLHQTAHVIQGRLWALGGVEHCEQWGDVRAYALSSVIDLCRASFDMTVVDVGAGLEKPHAKELLAAPRYEAASAAVAACDAFVAIVEATALGITRFLQHRPSTMDARPPCSAIALTPPHAKGSASAGAASLRDYGITLPIFELPRYATEELAKSGLRSLAKSRRRGVAGLGELQSWLAESVVDSARSHGEGSTTTGVPTRANL
ncbi:MAG: hypothetical protein Q8L05_11370 [Actinomycetota bacterium]|nr:hypothetical protein [Actinomycetota bacterium]MDP2289146.1 hypothetical protein [Actinomycetota bacterium]